MLCLTSALMSKLILFVSQVLMQVNSLCSADVVAYIFVFSAKPYHYLPIYEHGKVISKEIRAMMKLEEGGKEKPATVKQMETHVEAPGTSVTESVQDIVIGGGGHVSSVCYTSVKPLGDRVHVKIKSAEEQTTGAPIVYSKYSGTELEFDRSTHLLLKEDDIV
ncbi:hypothetical protein IFM89_020734, partial [Coptis chinensis]